MNAIMFTEQYKGLWVVEWSEIQKCFHIQEAETRIKENIIGCIEERSRGGWITVGIFNSFKEGMNLIEVLAKRKEREFELKYA